MLILTFGKHKAVLTNSSDGCGKSWANITPALRVSDITLMNADIHVALVNAK